MPGLLAFHAHPDDEVTSTGGTLARYADAGEQVVVVTATDGAEGEVHNYDDPESIKADLAEYRAKELAEALGILGVPHHEFLGYRDSGMMGEPSNDHPDCFWQADFDDATDRLIRLIRRYRPEVVTIYDPFGGYGHPDHINVHRVGLAAWYHVNDFGRFPLADGEEPWAPQKLYWSAWPRSRVQAMAKLRHQAGMLTDEEYERAEQGGYPDEAIDAWISLEGMWPRKEAALRAHRTQIPDNWFMLQIEEEMRPLVFGAESFVRVSTRGVVVHGVEDDLFNGLR
jgi:N-acetyl-1-D-myo-inositol-2-amino-2-deoxy-alpha-D-glucopyranoside deacetylase